MMRFRPGGLELTNKAAEKISLSAGDRVLDIGCGLGTSLVFLKEQYNIEAFGVDINPEAVTRAAAHLGEDRVKCADACALPFCDACFGAVFMECVLTLTDSPKAALREAARVLRPGGHMVISSLDGAACLLENGRIGREALLAELEILDFETVLLSDETAELRRFVAEVIFEYDSLQNYIEEANMALCGSVLTCDVPVKNTGYILLIAKKK